MSMTADISFMDMFFDRDDPVLKFVEERDMFKPDLGALDLKNDLLSDKIDGWCTNPDDLLNDILKDEEFPLLDKDLCSDDDHPLGLSDWKSASYDGGIGEVVLESTLSTCSDSDNISTDIHNDLAHMDDDDDDDRLSSTISTASDVSSYNHEHSPQFEVKQEIIDVDTVEEDQAVHSILQNHQKQSSALKKKVRQVVKVSNPRSVLLPVNTGNGVRTYKIVNTVGGLKTLKPISTVTGLKTLKQVSTVGGAGSMLIKTLRPVGVPLVFNSKRPKPRLTKRDSCSDEEITVVSDSEDDKLRSQYPRLLLSPEERKLMQKEGVTLPSHYPLTKFEERELKRIRRKIRNKISAQDSRKRKKEYMDGLEDRVKQCTEENLTLVKKIKILQSQNQSLVTQLRRLQAALAKSTSKTAQPATCLMVLLLSVALVMAPNLRLTQNTDTEMDVPEQDISVPDQPHGPVGGRSRSLLSSQQGLLDLDECLSSDEEPELQLYSPLKERKISVSSSGYDSSPPHFLADHDYDPPPSKKSRFYYADEVKVKDFITPAVDDVWPPPKIDAVLPVPRKPKEFIVPDVDEEWRGRGGGGGADSLTTEVKVNISDAQGTRTVLIQVPKERK